MKYIMLSNNNDPVCKSKRPVIISGPCSAESESQVIETARAIKDLGVSVFRAGIWKPRTRPGNFEGVGTAGLQWLKTVKSETGMKTAVEVANVRHVYEALKYGVDVLWIGARTTANPFSVQEIAETLRGMDIKVMIKNPVNHDTQLWLGAIERFEKCGIKDPAAVLRGVSSYNGCLFRNDPCWEMALELKKMRPDLTYICDPSHIAGNREMIYSLSQTAMDMNFDGLMIECHVDPKAALSDAKQQVTPHELEHLLKSLVIRYEKPSGKALSNIAELRRIINHIDEQMIDLLDYRMKTVKEIALFKKENNMTILQESRWNELMEKHAARSLQKGISPEFIIRMFNIIHQESIQMQDRIINKPEYEEAGVQ